MNRNQKRKMNASLIIREGKYLIRPALESDASAYVSLFDVELSKEMRDLIIKEKNDIRNIRKSLSDICLMILENGVIIGTIEAKAKKGTKGTEAYVEIYLVRKEDKEKKEEIKHLFIRLLKETYVYDTVYIYKEEVLNEFMVDIIESTSK